MSDSGDLPATNHGEQEKKDSQSTAEMLDPSSMPPAVRGRFEQFVGMFASHGPRQNPLVEKMDGQHISTVLANADKEDTRKHSTQRICVGAGVFAILLLCWMFLEYQKTEYLDAVVAGVVGLAGGYGIGRATQD